LEHDLSAAVAACSTLEKRQKALQVTWRHKALHRCTYDGFERRPHHASKGQIRIQNEARGRQRKGTFLHLLYEDTIGVVSTLERIDLRASRTRDHQGINLAVANRLQGALGFFQTYFKLLDTLE
jgi:hypothetical protein